jgi:hypothetical protein
MKVVTGPSEEKKIKMKQEKKRTTAETIGVGLYPLVLQSLLKQAQPTMILERRQYPGKKGTVERRGSNSTRGLRIAHGRGWYLGGGSAERE